MTGTVVQVSVSQGGIPKLAIRSAELTERGNAAVIRPGFVRPGDAVRFKPSALSRQLSAADG